MDDSHIDLEKVCIVVRWASLVKLVNLQSDLGMTRYLLKFIFLYPNITLHLDALNRGGAITKIT
jgi:hypothetical protein